ASRCHRVGVIRAAESAVFGDSTINQKQLCGRGVDRASEGPTARRISTNARIPRASSRAVAMESAIDQVGYRTHDIDCPTGGATTIIEERAERTGVAA